jgi:hypothetical protein
MNTIEWFKWFSGSVMLVMLLFTTRAVRAETFHGTDGERQVVGEMKTRLREALATGDINACQREGGNLVRYSMGMQGNDMIVQDITAIQRQLDAIKVIYKYYYDLRTLNNRKSVKQAFKLISQLKDKFTEDALDDVAMVFVPAPLTTSGMIAIEFYKSAKDAYGHYNDAGELKDTAMALKDLDRLVKGYDEKMKKLIPDIKKAEQIRTRLIACQAAFKEGMLTTTKPPASKQPASSSASPARGKSPFDGVWHSKRQHTDCSYSASEDIAFSTDVRGMTSSNNSGFLANARGRISGRQLFLDYGITNNVASGHAALTLHVDGKSITGTFSDKDGHKGTFTAVR